jgi:hypothetical protein
MIFSISQVQQAHLPNFHFRFCQGGEKRLSCRPRRKAPFAADNSTSVLAIFRKPKDSKMSVGLRESVISPAICLLLIFAVPYFRVQFPVLGCSWLGHSQRCAKVGIASGPNSPETPGGADAPCVCQTHWSEVLVDITAAVGAACTETSMDLIYPQPFSPFLVSAQPMESTPRSQSQKHLQLVSYPSNSSTAFS